MTPSGIRHVFHHFGSGSFIPNTETYLSRFMIINPIMWNMEFQELSRLGHRPEFVYDRRAITTIPLDMMINQLVESSRGNARHGSCGMGIHETILRHEKYPIRYGVTRNELIDIRDKYLGDRLDELEIKLTPEYRNLMYDNFILDRFIEEYHLLYCAAGWAELESSELVLQLKFANIIFEAAQGLALDQNSKDFPHVTHSNTGLENIIDLCDENNIGELTAYYMTRCYLTRHGAGPLPNEQPIDQWFDVVDPTNIPNEWQGSLRFAPLDLDDLRERIQHDLKHDRRGIVIPKLVITCMDQCRDVIMVRKDKQDHFISPNDLVEMIDWIGVAYTVHGPTRNDVRKVDQLVVETMR